jgi:CMP/dCMP kinase
MIITIDGPTGSGKSTLARLLAQNLGYYYLNTGLLYRALAYCLLHTKQYTLEQLAHPAVHDIQEIIDPQRLVYRYATQAQIFFDSVDITPHLKDAYFDKAASIVSEVPAVREALLDFQRNFGQEHNIVAEGRDTGSVVFPFAQFKFYLTATLEVRAQRWRCMQKARGKDMTLEEAVQAVQERDQRDSARTVAPLVVPQGAIVVDNSGMGTQETLEAFLSVVKN